MIEGGLRREVLPMDLKLTAPSPSSSTTRHRGHQEPGGRRHRADRVLPGQPAGRPSPRRRSTTSRSRSSWPAAVDVARRARPPAQGLGDTRSTSPASSPIRCSASWSTSTTTSRWAAPPTASWRATSAATGAREVFGEVYDELGAKFPRFVDVLRRGQRARPRATNSSIGAALRALAAHRLGVDGAAAARARRHPARRAELQ